MMLAAFACYVAFFVCSALLVVGLARALDFPVASAALLCAATAASWLAGFVVVGAPAGLGVREATFVALTGATLGEDHALLLIGLFRIVTFLGDTLFLAAGAAVCEAPASQWRSRRVTSPWRSSQHSNINRNPQSWPGFETMRS